MDRTAPLLGSLFCLVLSCAVPALADSKQPAETPAQEKQRCDNEYRNCLTDCTVLHDEYGDINTCNNECYKVRVLCTRHRTMSPGGKSPDARTIAPGN